MKTQSIRSKMTGMLMLLACLLFFLIAVLSLFLKSNVQSYFSDREARTFIQTISKLLREDILMSNYLLGAERIDSLYTTSLERESCLQIFDAKGSTIYSKGKKEFCSLESAKVAESKVYFGGSSDTEVAATILLKYNDISTGIDFLLFWAFSFLAFIMMGTLVSYIFARQFSQIFYNIEAIVEQKQEASNLLVFDEYLAIDKIVKDLNSQKLELNEKDKELKVFEASSRIAQSVVHDIRSPLVAIKVLLNNLNELPAAKKVLLVNSVGRIENIVDSLRDRYEFSEEKLMPVNIKVELKKAIEEKSLERSFKNIQLNSNGEGMEYCAAVSPANFNRMISNLLNNSIEAGAYNIDLDVTASDWLLIAIKDNGRGIPANVLTRLGKSRISTKPNGMGIGLSSAYENVRSWNGNIEIESKPGLTKILIYLPIVECSLT